MASSLRSFAAALLFVMLFMATELGTNTIMVAAAPPRKCSTRSNKFKGPCFKERNCKLVCQTEGFPDGDCKGVLRKCYCVKDC